MGDLNDNPDSWLVQKILKAEADIRKLKEGTLFNPWMALYHRGIGSLANQDNWSLFDQILLTSPWLDKNKDGFKYYFANIYKPGFMIENRGRFKGYPMRTWDGNQYRGGFSDHFPTYLILIKEQK
jgi:hypothetical protein